MKMRNYRFIFSLLFMLFASTEWSAQNFAWAKRGGLWAYDYGYGITTDNFGNVYVSGKYEMNANFNGVVLPCQGNHDIFLASYSPSGSLNWIRTAGGYTGDYATCVATDKTSSVYIAGEIEGDNAKIVFPGSATTLQCISSNDIFLAKYSLSGNLIWARSAGGYDYEKALGITYDGIGNVYICGLFRGSAKFGGVSTIYSSGDNDIFIAKYDKDGNFKWVRKAGSAGRDEAKSITCDASGNIYITGLYKNGCQFGNQTLYAPNGFFNLFLARYDTNGNLIWVKSGGGNYDDVGWGVTAASNGKIYVAGEFNATATFSGQSIWTSGSADVLVACYDASGSIQWLKRAGGSGVDRARGIGSVGSRILLTGQFGNTASFGGITKTASDASDIFMAGMDLAGNFLWAASAGGGADAFEDLGYESGNAICGETNGNVYSTGSMLNGAQFGATYLSSWSRTDMFIAKLQTPALLMEQGEDMSTQKIFDSSSLTIAEKYQLQFPVSAEPFLYPNPARDYFAVKFSVDTLIDSEIMVFNQLGVRVFNFTGNISELNVDISQLENGIYIVWVKTGEAVIRRRLIIQ